VRGAVGVLHLGLAALALSASACARHDAGQASQRAAAEQTYEQNTDLLPAELRNGALASASPEQLRQALWQHGAGAVVASLFGRDSDQGWDRVLAGIASGEQAWLDLAPMLRPGTDGHAGEGLSIALSEALQHNAPGVLRLVAVGNEDDRVCSILAIEPTDQEVANFYAATIPAVEAVREPDLQAVKAACLASLRESQRQG